MSIIPNGLKDLQKTILLDLFDSTDWTSLCTIVYPPVVSSCPNCLLNTITGVSTGKYNGIGPVVFTEGGVCPVCNGEGVYRTETTENIRVIAYYDQASFVKAGYQIDIEDGSVLIECKAVDKEKLLKADRIILFPDTTNEKQISFVRNQPFVPKGLGKDAFFYTVFKRAG